MEGAMTRSAVRSPQSTVLGGHVVKVLLLAVLATAVLPPVGAWWLNARRVAITQERIDLIAGRAEPQQTGVVTCGPSKPPSPAGAVGDVHAAWLVSIAGPATSDAEATTDAWGHCLLISDHWVLSAGANGAIETPMDSVVLVGDDIGVRR
jgi:hypothetical protein